MADILYSKDVVQKIKQDIGNDVQTLAVPPKLAIVLATSDESSLTYVRSISKNGEKLGISVEIHDLGPAASYEDIAKQLAWLAQDVTTHGIILQTPLPANLQPWILQAMIPPEKDVDGANPQSYGSLGSGIAVFPPATARAVMELLDWYNIPLQGVNAVVVGRSRVIGRPVAELLLERNATVTITHSKTKDIAVHTKAADVLVVATGKAGLITPEHVSSQAVIIDVGTNASDKGKLVGDVDFEAVEPIVKAISPVPGGVGSLTTALLLKQTCDAARLAL